MTQPLITSQIMHYSITDNSKLQGALRMKLLRSVTQLDQEIKA